MPALADLNRALALQPEHVPSLTNRALVLGGIGLAPLRRGAGRL